MTNGNSVTREQVNELMINAEYQVTTAFDKTVIVACKLPNGFVIVESSSCVDPANFDAKVGQEICEERIEGRIWELEGYLKQNQLKEELAK